MKPSKSFERSIKSDPGWPGLAPILKLLTVEIWRRQIDLRSFSYAIVKIITI